MIKKLHIKNFKSIKELDLNCARVNVFIGEPNTGKSNILEAIGIYCLPNMTNFWQIQQLIRIERNYNIFYNEDTSEKIEINLTLDNSEIYLLTWEYYNGHAFAECINESKNASIMRFDISIDLHFEKSHFSDKMNLPVKFYKFAS